MGWQSQTEVARIYLNPSQQHSIITKIKNGRNGNAFVTNMASVDVYLPQQGEADNWGDKYASTMSGNKHTSDEMWEAIQNFLRFPCTRAHLNVKEINFSSGHPADGGIWENWVVMDTALLRTYLEEYCKDGDMPESLHNVLATAHEHDDGQGGCWETVIIKHTVV